jgi:hypothetical protein
MLHRDFTLLGALLYEYENPNGVRRFQTAQGCQNCKRERHKKNVHNIVKENLEAGYKL